MGIKIKIILGFLTIILIVFLSFFVIGENTGKKRFLNNEVQNFKEISLKNEIYNDVKMGDVEVFVKFSDKEDVSQKADSLLSKEKIKYYFNDGFSAIINENDLNKLTNNPEIKSISLIGTKHIFLQDSTPLINATRTWTLRQNSLNLTGQGQTVCIIDTGVNYTHPDLQSNYIGGYDFVNNDADPSDDNGHGTHVAGIVAANGTIKGVASDAKIVALKVCDSGGSCADDKIAAAINWCVGNASAYNISVISMSLGGEAYTSYCDSQPNVTIFLNPINSAVAKNISVVVASGNNGYINAISSPACLQNATPVGSTNKADLNVSSFSNTWNDPILQMIVAPGEIINSTMIPSPGGNTLTSCGLNKKYCELSGTSMATPHVAGAIAIIKQYLLLTNQSRTPDNLEVSLNNTGKRIDDTTYSGLNFSRINIYSAIISLDNQAPNVTLVSPANNSVSSNLNQTFRCNASDLSLKNITFYLWNNTAVYNRTSQNINGAVNNFEVNITNLSIDNYKWNCLYADENNNFAFASSNNSLFTINPYVTLTYPENNSASSQSQNFNCSAVSSTSLSNVTLYIWNSTSQSPENTSTVNITGVSNSTTFNNNFSREDNYKWNCFFSNNNSNKSFAFANYSIIYDITYPNVTLINPFPSDETSSSVSRTFFYNVSDNLNVNNCSLIINGAINMTNSSINQSLTGNFTQTFSPGSYSWNVNCTDFGGNSANSSLQSFTITAPATTTSSGGGGGGGGGGGAAPTTTYSASADQLSQGYTLELKKGEKIKFVTTENHTLTVNSVSNYSASLTIQSSTIRINLSSGESVKLNLSSGEYYDLFIKLEGIVNSKANVTIKSIRESIILRNEAEDKNSSSSVSDNTDNSGVENGENEKSESENYYGKYLLYIFVLAVIITIFVIAVKSKKVKK